MTTITNLSNKSIFIF